MRLDDQLTLAANATIRFEKTGDLGIYPYINSTM